MTTTAHGVASWFPRAFTAVAITFAVLLLGAPSASAHAELVTTSPSADERLVTPPATVTLSWNEPVQTGAEQLHLISADGERVPVDVDVASTSTTTATITPSSPLSDGSWTVSWKVVSSDGHLIGGAYAFAVGDARAAVATGVAASTGQVDTTDRAVEALSWLGVLIAAGAAIAGRRRIAGVIAVLAGVAAAHRFMTLSSSYGSDPLQLITVVGEAASVTAVFASAVAVLSSVISPVRCRRPLLVAAGGLFVAQGMFSGHHLDLVGVAAGPALVAHLAHLFAGGLWTASIVALLFDRSPEQLVAASRRSTVAVAVLFPSALVLSLLLAWPLGDEGSDWFTNLVVKSALVAVAFILGAWHHRRVRGAGRIGLATIAVEVAVMAAVLGAAATLTQHVPGAVEAQRTKNAAQMAAVLEAARSTPATPGASTDGAAPMTVAKAQKIPLRFDDGTTGVLELDARSGTPTMWMLTLTDASGSPQAAESVAVTAGNTRAGVESLEVRLDGSASHWMGTNTIPFAGSWTISVAVFIDAFTVTNADATVTFASATGK